MKTKQSTFSISLLAIFSVFEIMAQSYKDPSKLKQYKVTVNDIDYTVKADVLSHETKMEVNNDRTYLWYAFQKIMETKGGYDGRLLNGEYRSFYLNDQLKEKGEIRYGLKHKEWKYWYPDGKLKEIINWKKGVKNGDYMLYNDYGQTMAKGRFKNNKLHARFYTYGSDGKILERKRYRNGNEVLEKAKKKNDDNIRKGIREKENKENVKKPSFFKRIFKKKNRGTKARAPQDTEENKVSFYNSGL